MPRGLALQPTILLLALAVGWQGCNREERRPAPALDDALARAAARTYADIAYASYADSTSTARQLLTSVDALLAAPSAESLAQARRAWLEARQPYAQTEVFRFYDGPIDQLEQLINTWPIDESYVESGAGSERLGIIDDATRYPDLPAKLLEALNLKDGETSVSTGYHVIELLLWGRDTNPNGPGERPYTDYVVAPAVSPSATATVQRRRAYLRNATALLVTQLEEVMRAWAPNVSGNYRSRFLAEDPRAALALAVKGMGTLSGPELSGERLTVPYETKDQENEHSCFSDSTQVDLSGNALGILNLCSGRYQKLDGSSASGTGICRALATLAPKLAADLAKQTAESVAALNAIPSPFDRAIVGADTTPGRIAVHQAIKRLQSQTNTLTELAQALGVGLGTTQSKP